VLAGSPRFTAEGGVEFLAIKGTMLYRVEYVPVARNE